MTNTLTYPISPDYVKSWTPERAIAELIANALDEDPHATATWADGRLVITDNGPGIPEEGMILGYSNKGSSSVGQFGEGSKVGLLVLTRTAEVTAVEVETVGYGFVPTLETRDLLNGLAPRRSATPPEVLVYTFTPDTGRTRGTRITITCPRELADAAIARFRHLTEPGYTPPTDAAEVILDGTPGRLYIGGVLVSTQARFKASYDFPLAKAKSAQNRDRTVIDAETLTALVVDALAGCTDPAVVRHFVDVALAGGRLVEAEKYFGEVKDPRVRAVFRTVARDVFAGRDVYYTTRHIDEASLDLTDGSYELVTTNLDELTHMRLMDLLGVEIARVARSESLARGRKKTRFVALSKLTAAESRTLDDAATSVRDVFGSSALEKVKVYDETDDPYLSCAAGFYSPTDGSVAISRDALGDPRRALEVLLHEAAHRRAHRRGDEYNDRTRGFENELTAMLGAAVLALTQRATLATQDETPDDRTSPAAALLPEPEPTAARQALADLLTELLPSVLEAHDVPDQRKLSAHLALHPNYLKMLLEPRPAGWRNRSQMNPSMVSDHRKLQVYGDAFGVRPAVLWVAHLLCEGPGFGRKSVQPGPWSARMAKCVDEVLPELDSYGGAYAEAADKIRALAAGDVDSTGDPDDWAGFAADLVAVERARIGLTADVDPAT